MNLLTVLYVILVIAGIAWIAYRLRAYVSQQKERESRWIEMASEDELRSHLKDLRKTASPNNPGPKQRSSQETPPPRVAPRAPKHDGVAKQKE